MKLIKPKVEILDQLDERTVIGRIASVSRTCYKTEDLSTPDKDQALVKRLIDSKHDAMLEFVDITVKFTTSIGITREIIRHRIASFANESTRYVSSCEKRNISEFDCDNIEDIIKAYEQGFSMREIAEYSSFSESSIRKILLDNNIQIRGLGKRCVVQDDYFSIIDSPEKAYLLGLIQTDGSICNKPGHKTLQITQHKDYAWFIKNMLYAITDKPVYTDDKNCKQISIGSNKIVEDLISLGIVPNKTYEQTDEDILVLWNNIPEQYKNDFIRGLIDGDGWVSFFVQKRGINESCNIGLCSVKEKLIDLVIDYIKQKFNYKCGKLQDGSVYKLYITDYKAAIEIGNSLYKNFKYPFGHPKKASVWIKRLNIKPEIANYRDQKFQIIKPQWLTDSDPRSIFTFLCATGESETAYINLRLKGWKAEQAREVLPMCTKSEICMKANLREWRHFLKLRCSKFAHPDIRVLALDLLKQLHDKLPTIFEDIYQEFYDTKG